jgi:hypothetical protein
MAARLLFRREPFTGWRHNSRILTGVAIIRLPYADFVVHDIRARFHTEPSLQACPMCHTSLRIIGPCDGALSDFAFALKEGCTIGVSETTDYRCDICGWLGFRENVEDYEYQGGIDHLLTTVVAMFEVPDEGGMVARMRDYLDREGKGALRVPGEALGSRIERALQPSCPTCRVIHVGWHATAYGGAGDTYLVLDGSRRPILVQLIRYETDECPQVRTVWLLNGVVYTAREPSYLLLTISEYRPTLRSEEREENESAPYLVKLTNPPAMIQAFAGESSNTVDALLEAARHTPRIWKRWVPLPKTFFAEAGHQRFGNYV